MSLSKSISSATAAIIIATVAGPMHASDPASFVLVDSVCQQLSSNLESEVMVPMATTADTIVSTCTVSEVKRLECLFKASNETSTFREGSSTSTGSYQILLNNEFLLTAIDNNELNASEIVLNKVTHRYVSTDTTFSRLPQVLHKQCVGNMK